MAKQEFLADGEGNKSSGIPIETFKRNELLDVSSETYRSLIQYSELKPFVDCFQILASDDNILGVGFGEIGDVTTLDVIMRRTGDRSISQKSSSTASRATSILNEELIKGNNLSGVATWFTYSNGDFENTVRRLQHPEPREEPRSEPERSLRSINSMMGRDGIKFDFFVKFE